MSREWLWYFNPLFQMFRDGKFVVSVQIDPPSDQDNALCRARSFAEKLNSLGVEIVDINSSRRLSADSLHVAAAMESPRLTTIPHITARDSTLNGLLNQVFGACQFGGVKNFLVITGDPYEEAHQVNGGSRLGDGVFHADSIGVTRALHEHVRAKLGARLALGASVNQNEDLAREGARIREKISAGTDFFMSQPIFTVDEAVKLVRFYRGYSDKPLLIGIWPLVNLKTLEVIHDGKIVGVKLPDSVFNQAQEYATDPELLKMWGKLQAYELVRWIRETKTANGVYLVAPTRNPLLLTDLIEAAVKPRTRSA